MEAKIIGTGKDAKLQLTISLSEHVSKSGKNLVIASTGGNQPTTAQHKGQVVIVGLNAYIKA